MEAKIRRQKLMESARQGVVLTAARAVMERVGIERSSMREIAREAGYTPGALYAFFSSKQALLIALLEDSLARLAQSVAQVRVPKQVADCGVSLRAMAWFEFLARHPRDWDLVVFFLSAPGQRGLDLEKNSRVHALLRSTLDPVSRALQDLGLSPVQSATAVQALLASGCGLLLTHDTTCLQTPEQSPQAMFEAQVSQLLANFAPPSAIGLANSDAALASQPTLFG